NSFQHSIGSPAVRDHLGIKCHSAVFVLLITCRQDCFVALHTDPIAGFQAEFRGWRAGSARDCTGPSRVWKTTPKTLSQVIEPTQRRHQSNSKANQLSI